MARQPKRTTDSNDSDRKVQPPRPPNAWILYRSYKFKMIRESNERISQAIVSKRISEMWRNESEPIRRYWEREAETKKAEHQALYPDYRFSPKRKDNKDEKKTKARDATLPPPRNNDKVDPDASPVAVSNLAPVPHVQPQTHLHPTVPQPYIIPYMPYGPGGPSPPLSAAPSPAPQGSPPSSSTSSSPSVRSLSFAESNVSSSSSQPPSNQSQTSLSSLSSSPSPYVTQPLLLQGSTPSEMALQRPANGPYWNSIPHPGGHVNGSDPSQVYSQNSQYQQAVSFYPLQGMVSGTDLNGVFNLTNIDSYDLLAQPEGDLELTLSTKIPDINLHQELFSSDIDFAEFQRRVKSLTQSGSSSTNVPSFPQDDLQSLFPNYPGAEAYWVPNQHPPTSFSHDMMHFLSFEGAGGSAGDNLPSAVSAHISEVDAASGDSHVTPADSARPSQTDESGQLL